MRDKRQREVRKRIFKELTPQVQTSSSGAEWLTQWNKDRLTDRLHVEGDYYFFLLHQTPDSLTVLLLLLTSWHKHILKRTFYSSCGPQTLFNTEWNSHDERQNTASIREDKFSLLCSFFISLVHLSSSSRRFVRKVSNEILLCWCSLEMYNNLNLLIPSSLLYKNHKHSFIYYLPSPFSRTLPFLEMIIEWNDGFYLSSLLSDSSSCFLFSADINACLEGQSVYRKVSWTEQFRALLIVFFDVPTQRWRLIMMIGFVFFNLPLGWLFVILSFVLLFFMFIVVAFPVKWNVKKAYDLVKLLLFSLCTPSSHNSILFLDQQQLSFQTSSPIDEKFMNIISFYFMPRRRLLLKKQRVVKTDSRQLFLGPQHSFLLLILESRAFLSHQNKGRKSKINSNKIKFMMMKRKRVREGEAHDPLLERRCLHFQSKTTK